MVTQVFFLPFLAAGFSGTGCGEDLALFGMKGVVILPGSPSLERQTQLSIRVDSPNNKIKTDLVEYSHAGGLLYIFFDSEIPAYTPI